LMTYKKRWSIETLFGNLKSRGFNLEQTHVTDHERLEKMVNILAIAVVWALKVGEWKQKRKPIKIKNTVELISVYNDNQSLPIYI